MLTDEELSALRRAAQILGEDYEVTAIDRLIKRVEALEEALLAIQNYDRDTLCYDAFDVASMRDIAFAALTGEVR